MSDEQEGADSEPGGQVHILAQEELERLKLRLSFWKFVIGTVALSLVTALGNWAIQWRTLQSNIYDQQNEFMGRFVEQALADDLEKRRDFAQYFAVVSPSSDSRQRWGDYLDYTRRVLANEIEAQSAFQQVEVEFQNQVEVAAAAANEAAAAVQRDRAASQAALREARAVADSLSELRSRLADELTAISREARPDSVADVVPPSLPVYVGIAERLPASSPGRLATLIELAQNEEGHWSRGLDVRGEAPPEFFGYFILGPVNTME